MTVFRRHLPSDTNLPALHVAINRIWDAIEAGSTTTGTIPSAVKIAGLSVSVPVSGGGGGIGGGDTSITYTGTGATVRESSPALIGYPTAPTAPVGTTTTQIATTEFVDGEISNLESITKDPTGFNDPTAVTETYDTTSQTVTLTGSFLAYWQGKVVPSLVNGWVSPPIPGSPTGTWFLWYDGSSYVWSPTAWTFNLMQIAYVAYDASGNFIYAERECHGLMPWLAHQEFHKNIGTYLVSGGDMTAVTGSTTAADRRPSVSACVVADEDLQTTNALISSGATYTQMQISNGASGIIQFNLAQSDIVPLSGSRPYYNFVSSGTWSQVAMANNSYMSIFLVAIPTMADSASQQKRFIWIQGQQNNTLLANEEAVQFGSINLGNLANVAPEFVPIGKVILYYHGGNWTIREYSKLTSSRAASVTAVSGGLTLLSRISTTWTTATLALNATGTVDLPFSKSAKIYQIQTTQAARVRMYSTSANRTSDAARLSTVFPAVGAGVMCEVITTAGLLTVPIEQTQFDNQDSPPTAVAYCSVTNLGASAAITVTVTYRNEEA